MKKVFFAFFIFFVANVTVLAKSNMTLLCRYDGKDIIDIYYDTANDEFQVTNPLFVSDKFEEPYSSSRFFKWGDNAIWQQPGILDSLKKMKCPNNAYLDTNWWMEFCFSNDSAWCAQNSNMGTDFKDNLPKTYDLNNDLQSLLNKFSYDIDIGVVSGSDIINGYIPNIDLEGLDALEVIGTNEEIQEKIKSSLDEYIKENFDKLNYSNYPDNLFLLITRSSAYNEKLASELQRVIDLRDELIEEANEKLENDTEKTEDEKEAEQEKIDDFEQDNKDLENAIESLINDVDINIPVASENTCFGYFGDVKVSGTPAYLLNAAYNVIKYIALVLLFVLSVVEIVKAISSGKSEDTKKAVSNSVKRLIIVVIIFFLPILISFIFDILGISSGTCGIGTGGV